MEVDEATMCSNLDPQVSIVTTVHYFSVAHSVYQLFQFHWDLINIAA